MAHDRQLTTDNKQRPITIAHNKRLAQVSKIRTYENNLILPCKQYGLDTESGDRCMGGLITRQNQPKASNSHSQFWL